MMGGERAPAPAETVRCQRCGAENPAGVKFCNGCGAKIKAANGPRKFESLSIILILGSVFLLLSILTNGLIRSSVVLITACVVSGLLGLYSGNALLDNRCDRRVMASSALSIAVGLFTTVDVFLIDLGAQGISPTGLFSGLGGPDWIFFAAAAWLYWRARKALNGGSAEVPRS